MKIKSESDRALDKPKYIIINVGWRENLLFELEQGLEWMILQASGILIKGDLHNKDRTEALDISPNSKPVTVSYMSEKEFKQLQLESLIDPIKEDAS